MLDYRAGFRACFFSYVRFAGRPEHKRNPTCNAPCRASLRSGRPTSIIQYSGNSLTSTLLTRVFPCAPLNAALPFGFQGRSSG